MQARLIGHTDLAGFRDEARNLLAQQVPPESVEWTLEHLHDAQFSAVPIPPAASRPRNMPRATGALVPSSFLRLCESVVLHRDPARFALMYRLLWRLVHEPGLRTDPFDADMVQAQHMAHAVRRDVHKMKANMQLMPVSETGRDDTLLLAWYEPAHHIVEGVVPWLARRQGAVRWALLTPERCVRCDGTHLFYGPGLPGGRLPAGENEAGRCLAGYQLVFESAPAA